MSEKQYKQTKLPIRFRKKNNIELTFHLGVDGKALFYDSEVDGGKFLFQVKWAELSSLMNVSCDPSMLEELNGGVVKSNGLEATWGSILKSHLQKAVRRQNVEAALGTSMILMKYEPVMFLRRLPIIVIEDTYLFRDYPTLIWLMIYYSEYEKMAIGKKWHRWLLSVVKGLCQTKWMDDRGKINSFDWKTARYQMKSLDDNMSSLIYALQLRKAYGGMHCDIQMLNWFSTIWLKRMIKNDESKIKRLDRVVIGGDEVNLDKIRDLKADNFILAGVDFHPCPWLIRDIRKNYPEYSENEIKKTVWYASSAINMRVKEELDEDVRLIWEQIRDYWELLCRKVLNSYLTK